jgi:hypothetical protein
MTGQDTGQRDSAPDGGGERGPRVIWGHSLAAAAVCLGTGAAIALIAIFG